MMLRHSFFIVFLRQFLINIRVAWIIVLIILCSGVENVEAPLLFIFASFLHLDALLLLFLLPLDLFLLLEEIAILNEFIVHLVINEAIDDRCTDQVAPFGCFIFQASNHFYLNLYRRRGLEPFGAYLLVSDSLKQPFLLFLIFVERLDLSNLRPRDALIGEYLFLYLSIKATVQLSKCSVTLSGSKLLIARETYLSSNKFSCSSMSIARLPEVYKSDFSDWYSFLRRRIFSSSTFLSCLSSRFSS
jgi:hypothetical protein